MTISRPSDQRVSHRRLPLAEKRHLVELSLRDGASVGAVAREHGVKRNSLYQWQALYRAGKLGASLPGEPAPGALFLPVSVAPVSPSQRSAAGADVPERSVVQFMLLSGATMRIETDSLDIALVSALLAELKR